MNGHSRGFARVYGAWHEVIGSGHLDRPVSGGFTDLKVRARIRFALSNSSYVRLGMTMELRAGGLVVRDIALVA